METFNFMVDPQRQILDIDDMLQFESRVKFD